MASSLGECARWRAPIIIIEGNGAEAPRSAALFYFTQPDPDAGLGSSPAEHSPSGAFRGSVRLGCDAQTQRPSSSGAHLQGAGQSSRPPSGHRLLLFPLKEQAIWKKLGQMLWSGQTFPIQEFKHLCPEPIINKQTRKQAFWFQMVPIPSPSPP